MAASSTHGTDLEGAGVDVDRAAEGVDLGQADDACAIDGQAAGAGSADDIIEEIGRGDRAVRAVDDQSTGVVDGSGAGIASGPAVADLDGGTRSDVG